MAANDNLTTSGDLSLAQETESPSTLATSSGNAPTPFTNPARDMTTSANSLAIQTPDHARPAGTVAIATEDNTSHTSSLYTRSSGSMKGSSIVENLSNDIPSYEEDERAVGGVAFNQDGEMLNKTTDTVDAAFGLQDGNKVLNN